MLRLLWMFVLIQCALPTAADTVLPPPAVQENLVATLIRVKSNPRKPNEVLLRLTVTNAGPSRIAVVRLPSLDFERYGGTTGWRIYIHGHRKNWHFISFPMPRPGISDSDIIDLAPGESFSLPIDLGGAWPTTGRWSLRNPDDTWLARTKGRYNVFVTYALKREWMGHVQRQDVSIRPIMSNILSVDVAG